MFVVRDKNMLRSGMQKPGRRCCDSFVRRGQKTFWSLGLTRNGVNQGYKTGIHW